MTASRIKMISVLIMILQSPAFSQKQADSLVLFSDLVFHSEFEKKSIANFIANRSDTFHLFMSIDENINSMVSDICFNNFRNSCENMRKKGLDKKPGKKEVRKIFRIVHDSFLKKYNEIEHFPRIFIEGNYNCVSASMLYALVFEQLAVPYKILQTPYHVYLVALPGEESIIVETTNPQNVSELFTPDFKIDYLKKLKGLKLMSEVETDGKSVDELFREKYYKSKEAEFVNFIGFEYLNKSIALLKENKHIPAYQNLQKAYFFFPDNYVRNLMYSTLMNIIDKCKFKEITDIDYLAQLSRFETIDSDRLVDAFNSIVAYYMQFTDKLGFCEQLHNRLMDKVNNVELRNDLSFAYNLKLSRHFAKSQLIIPYIERAILLKQNHVEANKLFIEQLEKRLDMISGFESLMDSINHFEMKYNYEFVKQVFVDYRLIAYLNQAHAFFRDNAIKDGEHYLSKFEEMCNGPIVPERRKLVKAAETAYRSLAMYYFYRNQKQYAQEIVDRGLKCVPGSRYIQTAVY
jgi:hypothetical protein